MKPVRHRNPIVDTLTLPDLCRFCSADAEWIRELVAHGVISPRGRSESSWEFHGISISRAKKARRLNRDLGINAAGVAMVLDLLDERDRLMRRIADYENT